MDMWLLQSSGQAIWRNLKDGFVWIPQSSEEYWSSGMCWRSRGGHAGETERWVLEIEGGDRSREL